MGKKDEAMQQKSPAEFFAENKNIAGFDNVRLPWPPYHCSNATYKQFVEG